MAELVPLDSCWLKANPLPSHDDDVDKNGRGIVLIVGGSRSCPGGVTLSAEAAFRAGAGKVTIATIKSAAIALGIAYPECGIVALNETQGGEIALPQDDRFQRALASADAIVVGPAMIDGEAATGVLTAVLDSMGENSTLVIDAAAIRAASFCREPIRALTGRVIMTPHNGEMAALIDIDSDSVKQEPLKALALAVSRFSATVMVKGSTSYLGGECSTLAYAGGGIGLATGGSGDVLAGLVGALSAQGLDPFAAAAWGIWLHGEAGRRLSETVGPIGFLARDLLPLIPALMRGVRQ